MTIHTLIIAQILKEYFAQIGLEKIRVVVVAIQYLSSDQNLNDEKNSKSKKIVGKNSKKNLLDWFEKG